MHTHTCPLERAQLFHHQHLLTHVVSLFSHPFYSSMNYSNSPGHALWSTSPHAAAIAPILLSDTCIVVSVPLPLSSAGAVRASSIFPILSVILLFMGGLCIAASEFYKTRHNIILSAGIFFVSAGNGTCVGWAQGYRRAAFPTWDEGNTLRKPFHLPHREGGSSWLVVLGSHPGVGGA